MSFPTLTRTRATLTRVHTRLLGAALFGALMLSACGGGGTVPLTGVQARALSADFSTRKAVAYSPFRSTNRDTETVTSAELAQDLSLLAQGHFGLIRLFDSSTVASRPSGGSSEAILQAIAANHLDIKVQLGIYVQNGNDSFTQAEIARGIALANTYAGSVLAVSVGNENMVSWSFNAVEPTVIAGYIKTVRAAVPQPVTADDNWLFYSGTDRKNPNVVLDAVDFVSIHSYAILDSITAPGSWNWQQTGVAAPLRAAAMMNASIAWTTTNFNTVRAYLDKSGYAALPITIGETGWKAVQTSGETFRASPVNQKMYLDALSTWGASAATAKPLAIFYFQAFDEPWKGSDDGWGLFNTARQARFVVQSLYPSSQWEAGSYTLANALYFVPQLGNATITASRYTVFADVAVAGEAQPTETPLWVGFNSPATAFSGATNTTSASGDAPNSLQVTPAPQNASPMFGWGLIAALVTTADDLSNFQAAGRLNFSIKSSYPGKIQVGFLTGAVAASTAVQAYIVIDPSAAQYGYINDGAWHKVSIPISAIVANATPAYGQPATAQLNMTQVTQPFTVADLYASTGKTSSALGAGDRTTFFIDNIYWSK